MENNTAKNKDKKKINYLTWSKPTIKNLGNAKEIVANINVQGSGDTVFSVLDPS